MIKLYFKQTLIIILIFINECLFAQWWTGRSSNTGLPLVDVQFVDENTIWVVGGEYETWPDEGVVLKSTDRGETWQHVDVGYDAAYKGIFFLTPQLGWIVGYYGYILKTVNGGSDWELQEAPLDATLFQIFFLNEEVGYVVGVKGIVYKTTDGGETWVQQNTPLMTTRTKIRSLSFTSLDTGYVVGHDRWILKTTDGGINWVQKFSTKTDEDLRYVQFVNDSTGYAFGERGIILKTTDYGETWEHLDSGTSEDLWDGYFLDERCGYAIGNSGTILYTGDAGSTWTAQSTDTEKLLSGFAIYNGKGIAVGDAGKILVSPGPPQLLDLSVINVNQLKITIKQINNVSTFNVYRDTTPYFTPDYTNGLNRVGTLISDEDAAVSGVQWTDTENVAGDVSRNYFYKVTAVGEWETDPSSPFGEFDYPVFETSSTDFNAIALSLVPFNISTAAELSNNIPGCNSLAHWLPQYQNFEQYASGVSATSYDLEGGQLYLYNVTASTVFTLLGSAVSTNYELIATEGTDWNTIMLPFEKTDIATASALLSDIPNCTSVAYFDAANQVYVQHLEGASQNNFDVKVGYPYFVNVTSNVGWPNNEIGKKTIVESSNSFQRTKAPHLVWGDHYFTDDISFIAYITERPQEILTDTTPGDILDHSVWMVQVGNFPSAWQAGEKLHVDFYSKEINQRVAEIEIELTYDAGDKAVDVFEGDWVEHMGIPTSFSLFPNYPNPFNGSTLIRYQLPESADVQLLITNMIGETVCTLVDRQQFAGYYEVSWNGRNNQGISMSSGIYFYQLRTKQYLTSRKMIFVK